MEPWPSFISMLRPHTYLSSSTSVLLCVASSRASKSPLRGRRWTFESSPITSHHVGFAEFPHPLRATVHRNHVFLTLVPPNTSFPPLVHKQFSRGLSPPFPPGAPSATSAFSASLHFTIYAWQTTHTLHFALYTPHSILCTPRSTLQTLHSALYTHTPRSTLHTLKLAHRTLILHLTLRTLHFTLALHTLHSTLYTLHSTIHTLHSTLYTWHPTPHALHSTLYASRCTLYTVHCTAHTLHCTVHTLHSTLAHFTLSHSTLRFALHFTPSQLDIFHTLHCMEPWPSFISMLRPRTYLSSSTSVLLCVASSRASKGPLRGRRWTFESSPITSHHVGFAEFPHPLRATVHRNHVFLTLVPSNTPFPRLVHKQFSRGLSPPLPPGAPSATSAASAFSASLHFTIYAWQTKHTLHFALYTPHSILYTPRSTLQTLHSALYTHTARSTLHTLKLAHRTLILHLTLRTLHFTLALHTLHSTLYTLHSTIHTLHFTLRTLHCTL